MQNQGQIGIYFHWPFCLSKCPYCDFNVHIANEIDHARWADAYIKSLKYYERLTRGRIVRSIFFGGGTPSLMAPETVEKVIDAVRSLWPCVNDMEVTLEANPTSIEGAKFEAFRLSGVNRVSMGVQSFYDEDLKFLGRTHSASQAHDAIKIARDVFERYSFDLIYARPHQTIEQWREELGEALALSGGHMSLYQLTIERNTPFYFDYKQKRFSMPKEELAADFYEVTQEVMSEAGMPAYEVSNHCVSGMESEHNLIYWRYGDYIGIGPGAHGRLTLGDGYKYAIREHHAPSIWLDRVEAMEGVGDDEKAGAHPFEQLAKEDAALECLMMGLRVSEGLSLSRLEAVLDAEWESFLDLDKVKALSSEGMAVLDEEAKRLTLSTQGLMRLNALVPYVLK